MESAAAPIVILDRRSMSNARLPAEIAPGLNTIGVMLPYTPLHHLLFQGNFDFLVATSANLSSRPLIYRDEEALAGLKGIADYFLLHNREIYHPCDDSVIQIMGGRAVFHRRARGYVPLPVFTSKPIDTPLLAVGGELKNAFALADRERIFLSQYIGDIENYENFNRFTQEVTSFQDVVGIVPQQIIHDAHPNYQTTRYALNSSLPKAKVQHHHAHMVSVLGEYDYHGKALGVICDGTGYGEDGKIWGFEFLYGDERGFERVAHLQYLPLPGGDAGAKHPLRIAYAYLKSFMTPETWERTQSLWSALSLEERKILDQQVARNYQVFSTSSAGRLFDAVSALTGVCTKVTYEGQAAIELESIAEKWLKENEEKTENLIYNRQGDTNRQKDTLLNHLIECQPYPVEIEQAEKGLIIQVEKMLVSIAEDVLNHLAPGKIAYRFHLTIATAITRTVRQLAFSEPLVISGGVFQNKLLTELLLNLFTEQGITVWRHKNLPPGDGGIALGQILIGNEVLKQCV